MPVPTARRWLAAALCGLLAACGDQATAPPAKRVVDGAVMKGAVQSATVEFYNLDAAGNPTTLVATVTTDAGGLFSAALPNEGAHLLAQTFGGSYADEADPATGTERRRITLPASPTPGFEAVLPPGVTSFAITPYSHALLIKARLQAAGVNFFNVFDAVRLQATQAFGFDPITTVPDDPLSPSSVASTAARQYALLLGAAAQAINAIAAAAGRLPDFGDVTAFIDDLGSDGNFDLVSIDEQLRRFRNNNFELYSGVPLPVVNEALLSQPAVVPNTAPTVSAIGDQAISEGGVAGPIAFTVADAEDPDTSLVMSGTSSNTTLVPNGNIVFGGTGPNRDVTVTPTVNGFGTATITVTVTDTDGGAASEPFLLTVTGVNDVPVAINDSISLVEGASATTLVGGATSVLANDTDADGNPLTAVLVSGPANAATFLLNTDGTFTYLHDNSETTADSFAYRANDGTVDSNIATVTINITPVNDPPVAVDDVAATNEDVAVGIADSVLLANDTDVDGPSLTVTAVSNPVGGAVVLSAGTATFTPTPDFFGTGSFDYTLSDGTDTDTGAVTVTVNAVNDAPSFTVPASAPAVNQDDPPQTVTGFATAISAGPANESGQAVSFNVTGNTNPTLFSAGPAISSAGDLTYTPAAGQSGSATIDVVAVDDGGTANGGLDTSAPQSFTITVNASVATESLLPYLTAAGDLMLFDPLDPANPVGPLETGLPATGFEAEMLLRAEVSGGIASNIRPARLLYIKDAGAGNKMVWKVNLEAGQIHTPVQVSNIADACRINGTAEHIPDPDSSIVRVDTAGGDGICNSGDEFTSANAWLVPVSTPAANPGVSIGFGNCCGIAGIADTNGVLTGVLTTEDDGSGSTFDLNRRDLVALATPANIATLEVAGNGPTYGRLVRGLGDEHIYIRARRNAPIADTTYKLLRFNVAANDLTELFDYGNAVADAFTDNLDDSTFDANNVYFPSADGLMLFAVAHLATGTGQELGLVTSPPVGQIQQIQQTAARIVFKTSGTGTGVYSVPKTGGPVDPIVVDTTTPLVLNVLDSTDNGLVYVSVQAPGSTPAFSARVYPDAGGSPVQDIADARWAGGSVQTSCDFSGNCEDAIPATAIYLQRILPSFEARIDVVGPATGAPTGDSLGSIFGTSEDPFVFGFGFGRFAQFTAVASSETDLYLGDTQAAAPPPAAAIQAVSTIAGNDVWLTFGSDEDTGPGAACTTPPSNLIAWYAGDGNTFDIQSGKNGALVGSASFATGQVDQAFSFDGASGSVTVADDPAWNFGANDFTIDLWANFDDASGTHTLVAHDEGGADPSKWAFRYDAGALRFQTDSPLIAPTDITAAPFTPVPGTWYHLAVTKQGVLYTLYIDGANVASGTNGNPVPDAVAPLTIGEAAGTSRFLGRIDEVEIFDRELTQAELQAIHGAGSAGKCKPQALSDADGDTLTHAAEMALGTNPNNPDTDADGARDGDEVNIYTTDPLNPDSDADDIGDGLEITYGSNPLINDSFKLYVDGSGAGVDTNDGLSWGTAIASNGEVATRQPTLDSSRSPADGLVYVLYQGDPASPTVYGTFSFVVNISNTVFIGSLGPGKPVPPNWSGGPPTSGELGTVFDSAGDGGVFDSSAVSGVSLDSIVLTAGSAADGGGLRVAGGSSMLGRRLMISNNGATNGGGVSVASLSDSLQLTHSTVSGNTAGSAGSVAGLGGGIYNQGVLTLNTVEVSSNTAQRLDATTFGFGGGLFAASGSDALLRDSLVSGNIADGAGGGLFVATDGASQLFDAVVIDSSTIDNNQALRPLAGDSGGNGGGICASGPFSVIDSVVSNNTAEASFSLNGTLQGGGGINAFFGLVLDNSKVVGNQATQGAGGGVLVGNSLSGSTNVKDSTFADNHAFGGPGGGLNLVDVGNIDVRDSRFLSNSSTGFPGAGLHLHMAGSATIFDNLFLGNHSDVTNPSQPGGGVEIETFQSTPALTFNSNTIAYNQIQIAGTAASGGMNVTVGSPTGAHQFRNNIVWFNDNFDVGAAQAGDNLVLDDLSGLPVVFTTQSGNNVDESGFSGSIQSDPLFEHDFYLQSSSPSVNGGDALFSAEFGAGSGFTTAVGGAEDGGQVDSGYHHLSASSGTFDSVALTPARSLSCASTDTFIFTPSFANAPNGEPGHLIVVELSGVTPTLGSLTTLDPRGSGSRIARDLGDGRYAVTTSGFHSGSATGTFTVYADDQPTPQTFQLTFTNAC